MNVGGHEWLAGLGEYGRKKKNRNNASSPKTVTDATMIKQKQLMTAAVLLFLAVTRNGLPTFEMCRS